MILRRIDLERRTDGRTPILGPAARTIVIRGAEGFVDLTLERLGSGMAFQLTVLEALEVAQWLEQAARAAHSRR